MPPMTREARGSVAWDALATHFESASALRGDAREAYLRATCGDDTTLATELRSLLVASDAVSDEWRPLSEQALVPLLSAATLEVARVRREATDAPSLSGTYLRHYEVLAPIGAGGAGVVYHGRDTRLQRDVALKFLSGDHWIDPASRARFEREARAVSSLDDPHICPLHAIEETDQGALCLVMAFCAGGTLRERLRAGALDVATAVRIATDLTAGLATAHRRRIVHGDLKPANVGFTHDGITRILDFGLAVRLGEDGLASRDGRIGFAGTLPYAAPELLRGGLPDVRTDLWALGVVLHEMLTGRRPFVAETESALVQQILDGPVPPLERADGQRIPQSLDRLVRQLLAKEPVVRPTTADEVHEALRSPAALGGVPARSVARARSSSRGRRFLLGVGVLAACAMASRPWWPRDESVAPVPTMLPTLAILPFTVRGDDALGYLREGMVDLLTPAFDATGLVRGIDPNAVLGAMPVRGEPVLDSATAQRLARTVGAARYVVGSVVQTGDRILLRATLYRAGGEEAARAQVDVASRDDILQGGESLVRQLAAAELHSPGDTVGAIAAASTSSTDALRAFLEGERALRDARPAAAVAHFTTAVRVDSLFALAWYRLARAARWSDVDSLSQRAAARASALEASLPLRLQHVVRSYRALRFGAPADAERGFRQIVRDYPSDVDAWMLLGETLFENYALYGRDPREAIDAFQRVMALDPRHREITVYLMELAARAEQHAQLDTLFSMYFSPNSAGEQPGIRETFLALHARRVRGTSHAITDPQSAHIALRRLGTHATDRAAAFELARVIVVPTAPSTLRLDGWLAQASLHAAAGRAIEADRAWKEARAIDAATTVLHRAMTMSAPSSPFSTDSLRAIRRRLETTALTDATGMLSDREVGSLRWYLVGLLSARLRDTVGVRQARARLTTTAVDDRLGRPLQAALEAQLRVQRGDREGALAALETSDVALPAPLRRRVPALAQYAERRLRIDVLEALNRRTDARRWADGLRDEPGVWGLPYLASAL